ncbi:MAG TPA: Maf family protein [bacterium]|nr:Maf family protein [bacterium]
MKVILASQSPRRQELLQRAVAEFVIDPSDYDESMSTGETPAHYAAHCALMKAKTVAQRRGGDEAVIGSDTIVVLDNEIYGKPADHADAARMLRALSGRTHQVISGIAVVTPRGEWSDAVSTDVTFKALAEEDIAWYIGTGEPADKAGAYAIQGLAAKFIAGYAGDYDNIVGLPVAALRTMLAAAGVATRPAAAAQRN